VRSYNRARTPFRLGNRELQIDILSESRGSETTATGDTSALSALDFDRAAMATPLTFQYTFRIDEVGLLGQTKWQTAVWEPPLLS
jgi:hypothetical protein